MAWTIFRYFFFRIASTMLGETIFLTSRRSTFWRLDSYRMAWKSFLMCWMSSSLSNLRLMKTFWDFDERKDLAADELLPTWLLESENLELFLFILGLSEDPFLEILADSKWGAIGDWPGKMTSTTAPFVLGIFRAEGLSCFCSSYSEG